MRRSRLLIFIAVAVIGAGLGLLWLWVAGHTVVLTVSDLQRELDKRFPMEKRELLTRVSLKDPSISLHEGTDRMRLGITATAELPGVKAIEARVVADGEIEYDAGAGELYFTRARVQDLEIPGLDMEDARTARSFLSVALSAFLDRIPVYRLDPGKPKEARARNHLKSLKIEGGRLVIRLGI